MVRKSGLIIDDKALNAQLTRAIKQSPLAATKALTECVIDLAGKSARRAPVESGDLRDNCHGKVNATTVFIEQKPIPILPVPTRAAIGEVGYSLPYALRQHEDLTLQHDKDPGEYGYKVPAVNVRTGAPNKNVGKTFNMVAGGEAKFLEKPFDENKDKYARTIAEQVVKSLG